MTELSGWITTDVAVTLTGYSAAYIRRLARKGRIGAKRVLRDWLVSREDLLAHKARMDALGTDKHNPWRDDLGDGGRR
jgi:excisionase family DNA binding protein